GSHTRQQRVRARGMSVTRIGTSARGWVAAASMVTGHPTVARSLVKRGAATVVRRGARPRFFWHVLFSVSRISHRVSPKAPTPPPAPEDGCILAHLGAEKLAHLDAEKFRIP